MSIDTWLNDPASTWAVNNGLLAFNVNGVKIRCVFYHGHNRAIFSAFWLPWVWPSYRKYEIDPYEEADHTVVFYPMTPWCATWGNFLKGKVSMLWGEGIDELEIIPPVHNFTTARRAHDLRWYIPSFNMWVPPGRPQVKSKKCSAVEGAGSPERVRWTKSVLARIGGCEGWGCGLGGPGTPSHCFPPEKFMILDPYMFHVCGENTLCEDFITEHLWDTYVTDTVPVYRGCTNVFDYVRPEAILLPDQVETVDWNNYKAEYVRRLPAVQQQKDLIRKRFNPVSTMFSVVVNPDLLRNRRPITLNTPETELIRLWDMS